MNTAKNCMPHWKHLQHCPEMNAVKYELIDSIICMPPSRPESTNSLLIKSMAICSLHLNLRGRDFLSSIKTSAAK